MMQPPRPGSCNRCRAELAANSSGLVKVLFSPNVHEIRAYNRLADLAQGWLLITHQVWGSCREAARRQHLQAGAHPWPCLRQQGAALVHLTFSLGPAQHCPPPPPLPAVPPQDDELMPKDCSW